MEARGAVERGDPLSSALQTRKFSPCSCQNAAGGEKTGKVDEMMDSIADSMMTK